MARKRKRHVECSNDGEIRFIVTKLNDVKEKLVELQQQKDELDKSISAYKGMMSTFEKQINKLRNPDVPKVSEHALVRYFERIEGFDLQEISNFILSPNNLSLIEQLGDGTYPLNETHKFVVKSNTVTTILPNKPITPLSRELDEGKYPLSPEEEEIRYQKYVSEYEES